MKLFDLYAGLSLDTSEFSNGIKQAASVGESFQGNVTAISAKAVALGHALYDVGKQAVQMAANLAKSVVTEYADTEQLLGGVDTIFKDDGQSVIDNAARAFRTAGMSANEYMETVTGFSSSLLQGLDGDTKAAASVADMAIQDMSDNANKFGTNIGMIQNAYQGFAKDNYTMLDNLKLGYGGTQEEMARLINDSGVLGDAIEVTANTVKDVPLDKIFEAIHIIQTEMDITGTTAKEASTTISGSFSAFEATWKNVLSGLGNKEADMDRLMDDLFDSGRNLIENVFNLLPTLADHAKDALQFVLEEVQTKALPKLQSVFRTAWNEKLPVIVTKGANGIIGIINDLFGTNIPHISKISLPTWEEIEASFSEWWASTKTAIEAGATWVLGIFTNPTQTADEIKAAISGWWEGTARPVIEGACQWVLAFPNMPDETKAEAEAIVHTWWEQTGSWISNACSWTLQMFNVPTESAEEVAALVEAWWEGIYDTVQGICKIGVSLVSGDTAAAVQSIQTWWGEVKDTVAESISLIFTIRLPNIPAIVQSIKDWWAEVTGKKETKVEADLALPDATASTQSVNDWWGSVKAGTSTDVDVNPSLPQSSTVVDFITKWWSTVTESLNLSLPIPSGAGVNENGMGGGGRRWGDIPSHATGLSWVPHDDYVARLHVGEAVLTRQEAAEWRNGGVSTGRIEALLSAILSALGNPVPAVIDGPSVYDYVSGRFSRDIKNKSFAL